MCTGFMMGVALSSGWCLCMILHDEVNGDVRPDIGMLKAQTPLPGVKHGLIFHARPGWGLEHLESALPQVATGSL